MTTTYTKNLRLPKPDFNSSPWHAALLNSIDAIDATVFGALASANIIPWANATNYIIGTTRIDAVAGSLWMCAVTHTSAASPTTFAQDRAAHTSYWNSVSLTIQARGEWAHNTIYSHGDIAYDSVQGIVAYCEVPHTSGASGTIRDEAGDWTFIVDSSTITTAAQITYDNGTSGLDSTNVQDAIDEMVADIDTAIAGKAPLASPTFTGNPKAPTPDIADNDTSIATTQFVQSIKTAIVGAAPVELDTLAEISTSLGGDDDFIGTMTTALGGKTSPSDVATLIAAAVASLVPPGTVVMTLATTAASGWALFDDGTIGNAGSGSSHANVDALAVFTLMYNNFADAECPITTSSGSATTRAGQTNASTAWAALCRIALPKAIGRVFGVAGTGSGLTARTKGASLGTETVTLSSGQIPSLGSFIGGLSSGTIGQGGGGDPISGVSGGSSSQAGASSPTAVANMQPTTFLPNAMVKL